MRGAQPLPAGHGRVPASSGRAPAATPGAARPAAAAPFIVERTSESVVGRAPDVAAKEARSLRGGERDVDGRIDLHGRVRASALHDLETFLAAAAARGARVVLVIHGRGHGSDPGRACIAAGRVGLAGRDAGGTLRRDGVRDRAAASRQRRRDAGFAAPPLIVALRRTATSGIAALRLGGPRPPARSCADSVLARRAVI